MAISPATVVILAPPGSTRLAPLSFVEIAHRLAAKEKVAEIKTIREKTEKLEQDKAKELEKVAGMSLEDAKQSLIKTAEKNAEQDLLVRIQKLEQSGEEVLERKAQAILSLFVIFS